MPNTAPAGTNATRSIPRRYTLHKADFGFTDSDGNAFASVIFTTLPTGGTLYYDSNGPLGGGRTAVVAGQAISVADILAGRVTYVAPPGVSGTNYDHFTFQVRDDGGTAGGGADTDPSPNTLTFDLVASAPTPAFFGTLIDLADLSSAAGFKIQGDASNNYAGQSVSAAGDVNGDGFADIIVGAPGNDSGGLSAGAAYVVFGKAGGFGPLIDLTGLSAAAGFKIQGESAGDEAGHRVSAAGDINGDGFADILVGATNNDGGGTQAGAAYVIFGKASGFGTLVALDGLAATTGFKIQGDDGGDLACVVSTAGDVNGDGFADIIVGAYGSDSGGTGAGAAWVIFGKAGGFGTLLDLSSLTAADGFKIQDNVAYDRAGSSVSSAGDFNGDGFDDIIVGARENAGGGAAAGAAYVIYGKAGGFGSVIDPAALGATAGFKIQGDLPGDRAGVSVASAGDVNGDGFADLVVGAEGNDSGGTYAGAAYVIFGKSGGVGTLIDLTALTAGQGFKIQGDLGLDTAGRAVSSAGDVNGDGYADILIGASGNDSGGGYAGAAYVIFGKSGGFGPLIDLTHLAAADGFKIQGDLANDRAGGSVSAAGDVNGDGFDDIIVGASNNGSGGNVAGAAYVIFGHSNAFTAPAGTDRTLVTSLHYVLHQSDFGFSDAEGNGFKSVILSTLPGSGTLYYDSNGSHGGVRTAIVAGQSIGVADIIAGKLVYVAGPGADGTSDHFTFQVQDDSGAGGALDTDQSPNILTLNLTAASTIPPLASPFALGDLTAVDGFKIQGDLAGDLAGASVAWAGDVNGDGFGDLIVGAPGNDSGGSYAGAAYVVFGKSGGFGALIDLTSLAATDGFKIQGAAAGDRSGTSVSSAGDIDGDGFDDIIVGAPRNGSGGAYAGGAHVILGKAGGFGTLIDLAGPVADTFRIQGDLAGDFAGASVSTAGDVNGDGFGDLIVGAYGNDGGGVDAGAAWVIFGRASLFGSRIDLTGLSATAGFKIQGDVANDRAGISVSSAGDVNGDGFDDLIVGAKTNGGGGSYAGAAYVVFGKAGGFGGLVDLTGLPATAGFKIQGDQFLDYAGIAVSSAGDINGDGFDDIMVGASNAGNGGVYAPGAGAAYVVFGKAAGFGALVDLTGLPATAGFKIAGHLAGDSAGFSLSSAGDFNGDGYADLLVAAPGDDGGGTDAGAAYVIFGQAGGFGSLIDLATLAPADGFKIQGAVAGDILGEVATAGDINGDGFADLIVGASRNDSGGADAGAAYVIFGRASGDAPPVAVADSATTNEANAVTITVLANDTDTDGGPKQVISVAGTALTAGQSVVLTSGARVTLNANGTLAWNPNHAFDATPAAGSGASNMPAHDSFTYTLAGGSTATVTVTVSGLDSNDVLLGTPGADTLNGGIGADRMTGGQGNDLYFVDNFGDILVEAPNEGADRLFAGASYTLGAGVSVETLTTTNNAGTNAINLTGNEIANSIVGNAGVNSLDGRGGADTMVGLAGDDFYFVDNAGDRATESAGGGTDRVFAGVSWTLEAGSSVETIGTTNNSGTNAINLGGNELVNTLIGNAGANILDGKGAADTMIGLAGDDFYYVDNAADRVIENAGEGTDRVFASISYALAAGVSVETLSTSSNTGTTAINLTGNELANSLFGNDGANTLDGKAGADTLAGFGGDDFYYVDDAADRVIESAAAGNDRVFSSVSYTLAAGASVETLSTSLNAGTGAINLTGNELANTIFGNDGANILDGKAGKDTLAGLGGDDFYYVDDAADRIIESAGQGADRVFASTSYTLAAGASVETLGTTSNAGTAAINLTGNELANTLFGNAGANVLDGKAGADILVGNAGADTFAFTTAPGGGNVDRLVDFQAGVDKIALDDAVFAGIGPAGALNPNAFVTGAAAADAGDRVIYNAATGQLFYDQDGTGAIAAVLMATLDGKPALSAADFMVI